VSRGQPPHCRLPSDAQAGSFKIWAPKLFKHYKDVLTSVVKQVEGINEARRAKGQPEVEQLRWNFCNNIFPMAAFNLGPKVETWPHNDYQNFAPGLCAITALGDYDPKKGGHLVLWELGLIIEFPPGSTILLPSACIKHSNTSVGESETRMSIAQYAPAGLFRWADDGFQLAEKGAATEAQKEREAGERCKAYVGLFSTLAEVRAAGR
jgi:hypothetical protein